MGAYLRPRWAQNAALVRERGIVLGLDGRPRVARGCVVVRAPRAVPDLDVQGAGCGGNEGYDKCAIGRGSHRLLDEHIGGAAACWAPPTIRHVRAPRETEDRVPNVVTSPSACNLGRGDRGCRGPRRRSCMQNLPRQRCQRRPTASSPQRRNAMLGKNCHRSRSGATCRRGGRMRH